MNVRKLVSELFHQFQFYEFKTQVLKCIGLYLEFAFKITRRNRLMVILWGKFRLPKLSWEISNNIFIFLLPYCKNKFASIIIFYIVYKETTLSVKGYSLKIFKFAPLNFVMTQLYLITNS